MPTISVLITSKNEEDFLDRSISSAINQTHEPHQIVIVDAASEDGSQALMTEYADRHPETIRAVLLDEDPGIPHMRNVALEHATGDLYTFLDGDDWFYPEKLERELAEYERDADTDIVYSNFEYVDANGQSQGAWITEGQPPTGDVLSDVIIKNWPENKIWRSALIDRSLIEKVGNYDEKMSVYEDWEIRIRLAQEAMVSYRDEILSVYRVHDKGVSSRSSAETHVRSLNHMVEKHRSKFTNSADPDVQYALHELERKVPRLGVFAHASEGNKWKALSMYLNLLWNHPMSILDYKLHLKALLPKPIFDSIVKLHNLRPN